MIRRNIHVNINDPQYFEASKDGKLMNERELVYFVRDLIRENATKSSDGFSLDVYDLLHSDKKEFLSYLLSQEDFEWYSKYQYRLQTALEEKESEMQYFINQHIDEVYHETMEEMSRMNNRHYYGY